MSTTPCRLHGPTGAGLLSNDFWWRDPRQVADEMFDWSGHHEASW